VHPPPEGRTVSSCEASLTCGFGSLAVGGRAARVRPGWFLGPIPRGSSRVPFAQLVAVAG
jgi:hypothetical protein